jgi:hypothetical protein
MIRRGKDHFGKFIQITSNTLNLEYLKNLPIKRTTTRIDQDNVVHQLAVARQPTLNDHPNDNASRHA